ncbi:C13 family peptidase [Luteibacter sp. Lutesp34]|uniref:C13 family peptidase n=1 Tax=Luteibacter sp. Lutesp34 TaxID=3243030 RepID=UPI0039B50B78
MPSPSESRRRIALTAVVAFAAGVALATGVLHVDTGPTPASTAAGTAGAAPSNAPAPAASTAAPAPAEEEADDSALDGWPDDAPTPEQVFTAQPDALRRALGALAPRTPGKTNLYAIAFGGDGSEDVFRNEAEYVDTLMTKRFGSPGHTVVLENNPATLATRPLASWTNLEAALDGLARVMDPDQDMLLLYVATHGGSDHSLLVDMDPIPLDQLDPDGLADILAKRPFRWKMVVINACYSGGFVPKIRGAGTLVLTSARKDRTSFGCGAESDITYFGRAWLADGLNATPDFIEAFGKARAEIAGWEKRDALEPSEPQIDVGTGIQDKLEAWRKGASIGPVVPFQAAGLTASTHRR